MADGSELRTTVKGIIAKVDSLRLYRGKGGEVMRGGVCHLIHSMALADIKFTEDERFYLF